MRSRHWAAGASTPWYVSRCARGLGTSAASRSRKANGSKTMLRFRQVRAGCARPAEMGKGGPFPKPLPH